MCGFRQGRGCMAQVFAVQQVCEIYLANGKDVFWAFKDLKTENSADFSCSLGISTSRVGMDVNDCLMSIWMVFLERGEC